MNKNESIPSLAVRLLGWFLRDDLRDEVTGDLQQLYEASRLQRSRLLSQLLIWYEVIHYLRPFALRKNTYRYINPYPMYKSYFKTAMRNMMRNKMHAFINITGLSVGMAVSILISLWIIDELSFEKHFDKYDRAGRIFQNVTNNGEVQTWQSMPWPLAEEIRKNYGTDFEAVVLTTNMSYRLLASESQKFNRDGIFAEPDFIKIFSLNMKWGNADVIREKSSMLISASTAKAFFGDENPIGKVLTIDRNPNLIAKVGGVYEDIPASSEFSQLHFIASWDLLFDGEEWIKGMDDPWRPNAFAVYTLINEQTTFEKASARIKDAKLKKVNEQLAKKKPALFIHPMSRWHLYSRFENGVQAGGRIDYVWMFGIIGGFVLLMACINFMNLSTARSEKRAKEVGIRKAIGSMRGQLISQFFSESVLTALCSLVFAALLVQLSLSFFNPVAEKNVSLQWGNPLWWAFGICFSVFIGIVAGSYPALYLSSIQSTQAIKGAFKAGAAASVPRKILVTIQFAVSVVLIIGTTVVFLQIQYAKNRPIGYESNGLLTVSITADDFHTHFDAIERELVNSGAVVSVAETISPTTSLWGSTSQLDWPGKDPDLSVDFATTGGSYNFGKTVGWEISDGRDFLKDHPADSMSLILNEAAIAYMGLKNPVGETIRWSGDEFHVIGVVKDIVVRSPYEPVAPTLYYMPTWRQNFLIMRINPATSSSEAITKIEAICKKYDPEVPFSYQFMDTEYAHKFGNEERVGTLAATFSILAVFISCLGIFGLSSFMAEQRLKEIGIRKVMGASVFELWRMMSKDFVVLVIASFILAMPLAYFALNAWLENYAYRMSIPWWTFVLAAVGTLLITLLTVSWHTINAAGMSPVKSLRSE